MINAVPRGESGDVKNEGREVRRAGREKGRNGGRRLTRSTVLCCVWLLVRAGARALSKVDTLILAETKSPYFRCRQWGFYI